MRFSGVWLFFGALAFVVLGVACGSIDPDAISIEPGHGPSRTGPGFNEIPDSGGGGPTSKDGSASKKDAHETDKDAAAEVGAETGAVEAGGDAADSAPASVFGATAYKGVAVTTSAVMLHAMKGGPKTTTGSSCLTCHSGATKGTVEFLFGGSVFTNAAGGTGAVTIEVRVVDAKSNGVSTYSDADGNFWSEATAALATPAQAGARNAASEQLMPIALPSGDCNSCHNGTAQPVVHVP